MRESIWENSNALGIAKTMDFVFVEDPALEGASVQKLQRCFPDWARADNMANAQGSRSSRYEFFVKVDSEGLWGGYVGPVQGWPGEPGSKDWIKNQGWRC